MSALGQKRTFEHDYIMSALPPKADIAKRDRDVRFGPLADSCTAERSLFDHLVGDGENLVGYPEAKRFGGREINDPDRIELAAQLECQRVSPREELVCCCVIPDA
jgi:hypothetical protein